MTERKQDALKLMTALTGVLVLFVAYTASAQAAEEVTCEESSVLQTRRNELITSCPGTFTGQDGQTYTCQHAIDNGWAPDCATMSSWQEATCGGGHRDGLKPCLASSGLQVFFPGQSGFYSKRRLHNFRVEAEVRPDVVVAVNNAEEVQKAVRCAAEAKIPVVAAGRRNSYEAICQRGCLFINTEGMKWVSVDDASKKANIGAGSTNGDMYYHLFNRPGPRYVLPSGTISHVGVAGLTLGGGKGFMTRFAGLMIDRMAAIELVLYNGTKVTADKTQHQDLFWLCRGGHGLMIPGVVTNLHYNLVDAPSQITEFKLQWNSGDAFKVLKAWQEQLLMHSNRRLHVRVEIATWYRGFITLNGFLIGGSTSEAKNIMQGFFSTVGWPQKEVYWKTGDVMSVVLSTSGHDESGSWDQMLDVSKGYNSDYETPIKFRALVMHWMSDEVIGKLSWWATNIPTEGNFYLQIDPSNGYAGDVKPSDTAYPWRAKDSMTLQTWASWGEKWDGSNERLIEFTKKLVGDLQNEVGPKSYSNYLDYDMPGSTGPEFLAQAYWGTNAERVKSVRNSYIDPSLESVYKNEPAGLIW